MCKCVDGWVCLWHICHMKLRVRVMMCKPTFCTSWWIQKCSAMFLLQYVVAFLLLANHSPSGASLLLLHLGVVPSASQDHHHTSSCLRFGNNQANNLLHSNAHTQCHGQCHGQWENHSNNTIISEQRSQSQIEYLLHSRNDSSPLPRLTYPLPCK